MPESRARKERRRQAHIASISALAPKIEPRCIECGTIATKLVPWTTLYRPRPERLDLMSKKFWLCDCGAYVGCHAGTTNPLGYPAGKNTQQWRSAAHAAFDPIWKAKQGREGLKKWEARGAAYAWLAEQLQITSEACHIGMMDAATAQRTAELCARYRQAEEQLAAA